MKKGNTNAALKLLTNNMEDGILPLNNGTLNSLKENHPVSKNANNDALLTGIPNLHLSKRKLLKKLPSKQKEYLKMQIDVEEFYAQINLTI